MLVARRMGATTVEVPTNHVAMVSHPQDAVQLIETPNYAHLEMAESLGNPYGPNGRAALAMMKLAQG